MVSYDCPTCGGSGKEKVVEIRSQGRVSDRLDDCMTCFGGGIMRNGRPEHLDDDDLCNTVDIGWLRDVKRAKKGWF